MQKGFHFSVTMNIRRSTWVIHTSAISTTQSSHQNLLSCLLAEIARAQNRKITARVGMIIIKISKTFTGDPRFSASFSDEISGCDDTIMVASSSTKRRTQLLMVYFLYEWNEKENNDLSTGKDWEWEDYKWLLLNSVRWGCGRNWCTIRGIWFARLKFPWEFGRKD